MKKRKMRKAFSMLTAIFVMIIMASVSIFVMSLSGKIVKTTSTQYLHEQAGLYAKSYTEFAVMSVMGNDRVNNCLETITGTIGDDPTKGNGFRIRTHIAYIGSSTEVSNCAGTRKLSESVVTTSTPLTIIVDAYVDFKDPDNSNGPWTTIHRRTVQKI